jgi:hypothetical protein
MHQKRKTNFKNHLACIIYRKLNFKTPIKNFLNLIATYRVVRVNDHEIPTNNFVLLKQNSILIY